MLQQREAGDAESRLVKTIVNELSAILNSRGYDYFCVSCLIPAARSEPLSVNGVVRDRPHSVTRSRRTYELVVVQECS